MTLIWKRQVAVTVANLVINDLRMFIDVRKQASAEPTTGEVRFFNMSRDTEQRVLDRGDEITIEAGYGGIVGLLASGAVQRVIRADTSQRLDRITRVRFSSHVVGLKRLSGIFIKNYATTVNLRTIVAAVVNEGFKTRNRQAGSALVLGSMDVVPDNVTFPEWNYAGPSTRALDQLLKPHGVRWYEDDGIIRFNRAGATSQGAEHVMLGKDTGLIGSPGRIDVDVEKEGGRVQGARARSLMNHRLRVGNSVTLESTTLAGQWKIVGVHHHGDSWQGNEFYSDVELRST